MISPTILVIDDDQMVRTLIADLLEPEGMKVVTADDGEQGLKIIQNMTPDLIILDMNMPKMSGIDFYEKIANKTDSAPMIPLMVLTGRGNMKGFFESLQIDAFMSKPFKGAEFIAQVRTIIGKHSEKIEKQ